MTSPGHGNNNIHSPLRVIMYCMKNKNQCGGGFLLAAVCVCVCARACVRVCIVKTGSPPKKFSVVTVLFNHFWEYFCTSLYINLNVIQSVSPRAVRDVCINDGNDVS